MNLEHQGRSFEHQGQIFRFQKQLAVDSRTTSYIYEMNRYPYIVKIYHDYKFFIRESNILRKLDYYCEDRYFPCLISTFTIDPSDELYSVFETEASNEPLYVLIFKYIEGFSLDKIAKPEKDLSIVDIVLQYMFIILRILREKNIAHRHIKPENVIYDSYNQRIALINFTLACDNNVDCSELVGSPYGIHPLLFKDPSKRNLQGFIINDVYALGILLFRLINGYVPFQYKKIEEQRYERVSYYGFEPWVPEKYQILVEKLIYQANEFDDIYEFWKDNWTTD